MNFAEFDKKVDLSQLKKDVEDVQKNAPEYSEVKKGVYRCGLDKLEIGTTKDGRPMLKTQFRIKGDEDGNKCEFTKHCIFINRVLYGTKNDANMISSAVGWLKTLEPSEEVGDIVFESYSQFAELVLDIEEDVAEELEYDVNYDPDAFNSISIEEVYEL